MLQAPHTRLSDLAMRIAGGAAVVTIHGTTMLLALACLLLSARSVTLLKSSPSNIYDSLALAHSARLLLPYKGPHPAAVDNTGMIQI